MGGLAAGRGAAHPLAAALPDLVVASGGQERHTPALPGIGRQRPPPAREIADATAPGARARAPPHLAAIARGEMGLDAVRLMLGERSVNARAEHLECDAAHRRPPRPMPRSAAYRASASMSRARARAMRERTVPGGQPTTSAMSC